MNKIEGLEKLKEMGLPVYDYTLYHNDQDINNFDTDAQYLVRRSYGIPNKNEAHLGVDRSLSYDEMINRVEESKKRFKLIIQKEIEIDYYGAISRFVSGEYYILSIEIFDSLDNRNRGIPCDRIEYYFLDDRLVKRACVTNNRYIKEVLNDIEDIYYDEFQMEFVVSNDQVLYTDFNSDEHYKTYVK